MLKKFILLGAVAIALAGCSSGTGTKNEYANCVCTDCVCADCTCVCSDSTKCGTDCKCCCHKECHKLKDTVEQQTKNPLLGGFFIFSA